MADGEHDTTTAGTPTVDGSDPAADGTRATGAPGVAPDDPTWTRLVDELAWYERKSAGAQKAYKWLKLLEIAVAASLPALIALEVPAAISASAGVVVVVLESIQQLYQFHSNWITYRSTAEALKHEQFLFLAHAGPYAGRDRHRVLAERIEGLISQEHAKWTESSRQPVDPGRSETADSHG